MQTFLEGIANDLYHRYKEQLADICIVFPNRRAGLFFRKYLADLLIEPIWSPEIITINDLFAQQAKQQTADQLTLLFELYNTWIKTTGFNESFDNFFYWGDTLLKDFNDVDKYLAQPESIFQTIRYQKKLDDEFKFLDEEQKEVLKQFWKNFETDHLSSHQKEFVKVWDVLIHVYNAFKHSLRSKNLAYEGMNYREIVENIKKNGWEPNAVKLIFIGFSTLNKCEEALFDYLQKKNVAEFYWDVDEYYLNDKHNEAGLFLRKNQKRYHANSYYPLSNELSTSDKETHVIGVPLEVGQAKVVGEILSKSNFIAEKTAVILPDEHLLFPVLHAIPPTVNEMNITMGYPFKDTQLYSFIETLIELQQTKQLKSNSLQFHHRAFISLLKHSYFISHRIEFLQAIIENIEKHNSIYISIDEEWQKDILIQKITKPLQHVYEVVDYLLDILDYVYTLLNKQGEQAHSIEQEYIYHFTLSLKRLSEIIVHHKIEINLSTFYKVLQKHIQQMRIPFAGEPLKGLQIMGLMETRCLDFENIFILSMNEGILPSKAVQISFIPYNIRKAYHLPISDQQDAIFAYYFYRSIQRAKNIYLLYNTEAADDSKSGEMSRFLYQLKYENSFGSIKFSILNRQIKSSPLKEICILPTPQIKEKLQKYVVNEQNQVSVLSPSAINMYLNCKLSFYFKYIAGLYEKEEVTEDIAAADFGNLLHKAMEVLYKPYINKMVTTETISEIKKQIEEAVIMAFDEYYGNHSKDNRREVEGKNIIIKHVIEEYIQTILKKDSIYAPFEIKGIELGSEEKLYADIACTINGEPKAIRIGGKIDRIDKKGEQIRIIDYKTGNDQKECKDIASLFNGEDQKRNKAAFQILLYSMLYQRKYTASTSVEPGLYTIKEMFSADFSSRLKVNKEVIYNIKTVEDEYQLHLKKLLEEIFNMEKAYEQTKDMDKCERCPYNLICNRN